MLRAFIYPIFIALFLIMPFGQRAMSQETVPDMPDALEALIDRGAQARFLGTKYGMHGWVTIFKGQEQYYYSTPDGQGFLLGLLFDKEGEMVTVNQVRELQSQSDDVLDVLALDKPKQANLKEAKARVSKEFEYKSPAERMFMDIENSNWIKFGSDDAPIIYSFMDPQCPHCHSFMKDLRDGYLDKGLVQIRMIPVGFREETLAQAAFLLASSDSQERWYKHLDGDVTVLPAKTAVNTQGVQKNLSLMQAWKFSVTPMTIYRGKDGKIKIIRGRASDMNKIIADLPAS